MPDLWLGRRTLRVFGREDKSSNFLFLQMVSAVCQFPSIQAAVDTTVQTLQSGVPIARIGSDT